MRGNHARVDVVQLQLALLLHQPVKQARDETIHPAVLSRRAPSHNEIEAVVKFFQEARQRLHVDVYARRCKDQTFTERMAQTGVQRGGFAKRGAHANQFDLAIFLRDVQQLRIRVVCARVVDENQFKSFTVIFKTLSQRLVHRRHIVAVIKSRHDHRNLGQRYGAAIVGDFGFNGQS